MEIGDIPLLAALLPSLRPLPRLLPALLPVLPFIIARWRDALPPLSPSLSLRLLLPSFFSQFSIFNPARASSSSSSGKKSLLSGKRESLERCTTARYFIATLWNCHLRAIESQSRFAFINWNVAAIHTSLNFPPFAGSNWQRHLLTA